MPKNTVSTERLTEKALLVYVNSDEADDEVVETEFEGLCEAAHVEIAGSIRQRLDRPHTGTYIGKGKVEELKVALVDAQADVVILDGELSGIQGRNLSEATGRPVLDRTQLILDIFAARAHTREGQLQVELAQLTYMMPRLMSVYTKFERQKGGIGMRGPGETKLESDRRMIKNRITRLSEEIDEVKRHRDQQRQARRKHPFPFATIVGYTSAGKSTLMNRLSGTNLLADAMPFATLDPTTRKVDLPDGYSLFLTDTVGFIRNLPTHLIAAFQSTLEEVTQSDFVIHVIDISHENWDVQRDAVMETLSVLKAADKPSITVFNKIDAMSDPSQLRHHVAEWSNSVGISATKGTGVQDFLNLVVKMVKEQLGMVRALIPYTKNAWVDECYRYGRVHTVDYREDGIFIEAELVSEMRSLLAPYAVEVP